MTWYPNCVFTGPTGVPKGAFSAADWNAGTNAPAARQPTDPPFWALPVSVDFSLAIVANEPPAASWSTIACASVWVVTRMWATFLPDGQPNSA